MLLQRFTPQQVKVRWNPVAPTWPEMLQADIHEFWQTLPKDHIFNGSLARLDEWRLEGRDLILQLRPSDYMTLLHSNAHADEIVQEWGTPFLANVLGISVVFVSSDAELMLMKRSEAVGEYPGCLDVFGGHVDVPEQGEIPDVFAAMAQEIQEEMGVPPSEYEMELIGLIQQARIQKPELVFFARSRWSTSAVRSAAAGAVDRNEFVKVRTLPASDGHLERCLTAHAHEMSPSAYGSLVCAFKYGLNRLMNIEESNWKR